MFITEYWLYIICRLAVDVRFFDSVFTFERSSPTEDSIRRFLLSQVRKPLILPSRLDRSPFKFFLYRWFVVLDDYSFAIRWDLVDRLDLGSRERMTSFTFRRSYLFLDLLFFPCYCFVLSSAEFKWREMFLFSDFLNPWFRYFLFRFIFLKSYILFLLIFIF